MLVIEMLDECDEFDMEEIGWLWIDTKLINDSMDVWLSILK